MLLEIQCDKFIDNGIIRPPIIFHEGLNVILGDQIATNSIGKSTFLLIIDFVFGGNDYPLRGTDIIEHIGEHVIKFTFQFGQEKYYFTRSTSDFRIVKRCEVEYIEKEDISIDQYCQFLAEQYGITQQGLSFRQAVSRYFRVYMRDNLDEKHPLHCHRNDKEAEIILELEKLFEKYDYISKAKEVYDEANNRKNAFTLAAKNNFIQIVSGKKEYEKKKEELSQLQFSQEQYLDEDYLKNKTSEEIIHLTELRKELQRLRIAKSRLDSKLIRIENQISTDTPLFSDDFLVLKQYFPDINIKHIEEVEEFHKTLSSILHDELSIELQKTQEKLNDVLEKIKNIGQELGNFDIPNNISKKMLQEYSKINQQIATISKQLQNYDDLLRLKKNVKEYLDKYQSISQDVLVEIERCINTQMQIFDDFIYKGQKKPPELKLLRSKYIFRTIDDTGTGTSYKSLVVLDLSILKLTNLPALIHDSPIFKNIGDEPISRMIELYTSFYKKQIFIALDKSSSYDDATRNRLENAAVLRLSGGDSALFGRCWNNYR